MTNYVENTKFVPNSLNESVSSTETIEPGLEPGRGSTPKKGSLCSLDQANVIRAKTRSQVQAQPPVSVLDDTILETPTESNSEMDQTNTEKPEEPQSLWDWFLQ